MQTSIKLGDKIELVKKTDLLDADIYFSMIYSIDDELLRIQAPIESGKIIPLEFDATYYMNVYTEKGLLRAETVLEQREKTEHLHILAMKPLTMFKKYQRRQYYRLNCTLNLIFQDAQTKEVGEGTVLDISGGGMRFSTDKQLSEEEVITCHLCLRLKEETVDLDVKGKIIQSKIIEPEKIAFQNRLEFIDLSLEKQETIIKFIFEEERRRRKKEKGM
ncbi:PilZ domain-containing protein [Vallitaleaceae bacterium 9-2]